MHLALHLSVSLHHDAGWISGSICLHTYLRQSLATVPLCRSGRVYGKCLRRIILALKPLAVPAGSNCTDSLYNKSATNPQQIEVTEFEPDWAHQWLARDRDR